MAILKIWDGSSWVKVGEDTKVVAGTYRGNNKYDRFINLGFTPKYVFLMSSYYSYVQVIHSVAGLSLGWYSSELSENSELLKNENQIKIDIVTNGFKVGIDSSATNDSPRTYYYVAIG